MTTSLIGRKVRLTGEGWDGDVYPARYSVHVIHHLDDHGDPRIKTGRHHWLVLLPGSTESASMRRDWSAELLPQTGALEVRPYAVGFLDGMVGLAMQDGDDEYERGYLRGADVAARLP